MMCYMDRTFCPFADCVVFTACPFDRALTEQRKKDAAEWWGLDNNPPISIFSARPDCFKARDVII